MFWNRKTPTPDDALVEKFRSLFKELQDVDRALSKRKIYATIKIPNWTESVYSRPSLMELSDIQRVSTNTERF